MYFIPGLDYSRFWCEYAEDTFHIKVRQYQHWDTSNNLRNGDFRSPVDVPAVTIKEIDALARREAGIEWVGYGIKSRDSLERRGILAEYVDGINYQQKRFAPVKDWSNKDVLAYLSRSGVSIPDVFGRSFGIGLTPEPMLYLRENWPNDYERVLAVFPHACAQADRALGLRQQKEIARELARRNRPERPKRVRKDGAPVVPVPGDSALQDPDSELQSEKCYGEGAAVAQEADREEQTR